MLDSPAQYLVLVGRICLEQNKFHLITKDCANQVYPVVYRYFFKYILSPLPPQPLGTGISQNGIREKNMKMCAHTMVINVFLNCSCTCQFIAVEGENYYFQKDTEQ